MLALTYTKIFYFQNLFHFLDAQNMYMYVEVHVYQ